MLIGIKLLTSYWKLPVINNDRNEVDSAYVLCKTIKACIGALPSMPKMA